MDFLGTRGDDNLTGTSGDDLFKVWQGGDDVVSGLDGNDVFNFAGALTAADTIDGGSGTDKVVLKGDYSGGLTFGATTMVNVETLQLAGGFDYSLTTNDANVAASATLTVNAKHLGAGDALTFDGSAETDGNFHLFDGAGDDALTGGAQGDLFDLSHGGNDTASGGGGNDLFRMGATLTAADSIDGGGGNDRVDLAGISGDTLTFSATTMVNVETLLLAGGHNYDIVTDDATVAAGATMLIAGNRLGAGDTLTFDGSAETDGHFIIRGGAGNDVLTGGQNGDTFNLKAGGEDTVHGGAGDDTINMGASFDSGDQIDGGAGNNTLSLNGNYSPSLTVSGAMAENIGTVTLAAGNGYDIIWQSAIGSSFTVDASAVGSGDSVQLDTTALTSGNVHFIAGAGESVFRGGAGDDVVDVQNNLDGLNVFGGDGDDTVNFGAVYGSNPFQAADGGTGSNTATFDGDYSSGVTVGPSIFFMPVGLRDFQTIELLGGHSYGMNFDDSQGSGATLTGGAALTVDASALGAGDQAYLDFELSQAPTFTVTGGAGDDDLTFAANFSASDTIDGGAGNDTLELNGDYSAGLTFGATTMTNVETLQLDDGYSYNLVTNDATVASGQTLTVDASSLTGTNALTFDGSAETNGLFAITGGAGDDTVKLGSHFSVNDSIDGGAGDDTVTLTNVHGTFHFTDTTIQNVDDLVVTVTDGFAIAITTTDANVAAGATMTVDFSNSGSTIGTGVTFDGSAETDGHFAFIEPHEVGSAAFSVTGGALSDTLSFTHGDASGSNTFNGLGGDDTLTTTANASPIDFDGGTGNDTLAFTGGGSANAPYGLTSVENVTFDNNNWNVLARLGLSAPASLNIDATALSGGHTIAFDGSDATNANDSFVFEFAGNFIAGDNLTGGSNNDTLALNGDYSGVTTFGASQLTSIETITVADGHTYDLVTNDANIASGATLTVDASALTGSNQLFFDGSAETDGHFAFIGGAADDDLQGGAQSDTFDLSRSDGAFVSGNGGDDSFTVTSAAHLLDDSIDGGAGSDTLILNGDFSAPTTLSASNLTSIETLQLGGGYSYDLVSTDPIVASGAMLMVDASALGAGDTLTFDGSAETNGHFTIYDSSGSDVLTGGALSDFFDMVGGGADTVHGGGGNDAMFFSNTLIAADTIDGGAGNDVVNLSGDYTGGNALVFGASTMTNVETLYLYGGDSYDLTTNDATVNAGQTLTVEAGALGAGDTLTFDGSAETDGNFVFEMGASFTASDSIAGGAGNDTVMLDGDYSSPVSFGSTTMQSIDTITLGAGYSYSLNLSGNTVASGGSITIDGSALGSGDSFNFGFDSFGGGDATYILKGGAGSDEFSMLDTLTAADQIDGGGGGDYLFLNGDYSAGITFNADTIANISGIYLVQNGSDSYNLTTNDGNVAAGQTMFVSGANLLSTASLTFDGSAETDGTFDIISSAGANTLTGGALADTIDVSKEGATAVSSITGGGGADLMTAGAGADEFIYNAASESTSVTHDTIVGFDASADKFDFHGAVGGFDGTIDATVNAATFDSDLGNAFSDGITLHGDHAWAVFATGGDLAGHEYLIVDANNNAHYDPSTDYVIEITGFSGSLTAANFI